MFAVQADGAEIMTVEGLAGPDGDSAPGATGVPGGARAAVRLLHPGFRRSVTAFLGAIPIRPTRRSARAISGNLCRCTGYQGIFARCAVRRRATRGDRETAT